MKKLINFTLTMTLITLVSFNIFAQKQKMFYATMGTNDAVNLKKNHPKDVKIIKSYTDYSVVMLNHTSAEELHHTGLRHGPGYFLENSKEEAIKAIEKIQVIKKRKLTSSKRAIPLSITQDVLVNQSLNLVNNTNIKNQITQLESYGTRFHTFSSAQQSAVDLKAKWENMSSTRSDISVKLVSHTNTPMSSVVMTITGSEKPDEYVILGGHLDSTSREGNANAPGADDNASGIATITEVARVLLSMNYKPKRTVEFMAFAAEEIGLVGSKEIARDYKNRNVNIISYLQLDMTNYKGSTNDIYITTDSYNSTSLNNYLTQLMDHYNASGTHKITYGTSRCNYGCSDHHSFAQQGYETAFPIEATLSESNPYIHTAKDTSSRFPTANAIHAAKFAKLALEYLIEISNIGSGGGGGEPTYCSSNGQSTSDEYISNVNIGSINNNSNQGTNGYSNHTSISTDLEKGKSQTISITPKWASTKYNEGYAVFIDYNNDGDFSDSGETVWTKSPSKETPVSGTFTVPSTVSEGKKRMRVILRYNTIPSSCGSYNYGETEDYFVNIISAQADTQPPTTPSNLVSSNVAQTTLTLNWTASTDNLAVTGYDVYQGTTKLETVTTTSYNVTGLTANTAYTFSIKAKDAAGNISPKSNDLNVTTLDNLPTYCNSKGERITYEWIDYVSFGGMTNTTTANGGYGDFTSKIATVTQGTTNQVIVSAGFSNTAYNEYFTIWIDYNRNGTFESNEKTAIGSSNTAGNRTANISIPSTATLGQTRMRVSMKYNGASTACETFPDGEVEDYTVNIVNSSININSKPDLCSKAKSYDSSINYNKKDLVSYAGSLYERTTDGWNRIGNCKTSERNNIENNLILANDNSLLNIYPNPSSQKNITITVNNELWKAGTVLLFDIKGNILKELKLKDKSTFVNTTKLSTGIYFLTLFNNSKSYSKKVIIK
ncbi:M20/M25/M40 family metallo-hydrolase [Tenacibaculum halocynthiae]|uniref:M20/M25/M40 family metallo-hydrolase n=1 Tax=Tenacibaculum halocynthiae TaxID=1254437 RepID=UPI003D658E97